MTVNSLYRYIRADGGTTISTQPPPSGVLYETLWRIIADENKILTNDIDTTYCIDLEDITGWYEIDDIPQEEEILNDELEDAKNALRILGVNVDG